MPKFGRRSSSNLASCHRDLRVLFRIVVAQFDCSVIGGGRGKRKQNKAFREGKSKLRYPQSKHNKAPKSFAADVVPYPIEWKNTKRMRLFAGFVLGVASQLYKQKKIKHKIRWGGDWDRDTRMNDQRFDDLPHFEMIYNKGDK